jgi:hypothetical protein
VVETRLVMGALAFESDTALAALQRTIHP